jgi:hypothetical protein
VELDTGERLELLAEWDRQKREKKPDSLEGYGCLMMLIGAVMIFALPKLVSLLGIALPQAVRSVLLAFFVLLVVGGLILRSVRFRGGPLDVVDRAVATLGAPDLTPEARRRETVALLMNAETGGQRSSPVYDPAVIRPKLGAAIDYVLAAQEVLYAEKKTERVFMVS